MLSGCFCVCVCVVCMCVCLVLITGKLGQESQCLQVVVNTLV